MIFDVILFQFHLFKNLEQNVIKAKGAVPFRASPSIRPAAKLFSAVGSNFEAYARFIQSTFRLDVDGQVFYVFFRNALNKIDRSFTWPSSIEVVQVVNKTANTIFKYHYFNNGQSSDFILPSQCDPDYSSVDDMKRDIKIISDYVVQAFMKIL